MTPEEINYLSEINPDAPTYNGFDDAIIGMAERINLGPVFAYSTNKIIEILMNRDGMEYEEAVEFFDFNIQGGWIGEFTPVFITFNQ